MSTLDTNAIQERHALESEERMRFTPGLSRGASARRRLGHGLTECELAVMRQMSSGLDRQGIATALGVSLNTVKYHCKNIYSKLDVEDRTEAIHRVRPFLEQAIGTGDESGAD